MFLPIHSYKKPQSNSNHSLSDAIKLATTTGVIATSIDILSNHMNKKALEKKPTDYLFDIALIGAVGGALHVGIGYFTSMWREVTEYRPDKPSVSINKLEKKFLHSYPEESNNDLYT